MIVLLVSLPFHVLISNYSAVFRGKFFLSQNVPNSFQSIEVSPMPFCDKSKQYQAPRVDPQELDGCAGVIDCDPMLPSIYLRIAVATPLLPLVEVEFHDFVFQEMTLIMNQRKVLQRTWPVRTAL